jgi:hypothetical protein
MNEFAKLFAMLAAANPMRARQNNPFKRQATPTHKGGSAATRRGAKHKVNPTFRSRRILPITPAQYRRYHFGAKVEAK